MSVTHTGRDLFKGIGELIFPPMRTARYIAAATYGFVRANPPIWNLMNRGGNALYRQHPPHRDQLQQQVVNGLVANGVAMVHLDDMFQGTNFVSDMMRHPSLRVAETKVGVRKTFLRHFGGVIYNELPTIDLDCPFICFSLSSRVLDIVNSYMNTCCKLISFDLAMTSLMKAGAAPMYSQRWHRDPGLNRLVKIFIYLTDVDEQSGPFMYVLQSHAGGRWRRLFPQKQFGRHGFYPPEGSVDRVVPKDDIVICRGRAGTVIFCDTTGLHKGGYSISRARMMFTSMYVAGGDVIKPMFRSPIDFEKHVATRNPVSRFAVT